MTAPRIPRRLVEQAINLYNRFRAPEAVAKLVDIHGDRITVKFEGNFCKTCGINDWVEDMKYVLEDLGVDAELVEIREPELPEDYRVGVFRIKGPLRREGKTEIS